MIGAGELTMATVVVASNDQITCEVGDEAELLSAAVARHREGLLTRRRR